jgi:pyruvate formate lyase activating enzyme
MTKLLTGKIYDIQGFSLQDGPGIRTTVFLKGCPLRCPWCHSPESQEFCSQLSWMSIKCVGMVQCEKCLAACPHNAISPGKWIQRPTTQEQIQHIHIDRALCDNCGKCTKVCVYKALYMCGEDYTVDELIKRVSKDIPFYEQSGGGVTVSGGEPLSQPEFTRHFLKKLKECGIHTALDTTGFAPFNIIESVLPYTDLFLFDLKHMDSTEHKLATGVSNDLILENAVKIAEAGASIQIRLPLIPHFNDSEENIRETGIFCKSLGKAVNLIQLLPYHNLGVIKYQRIDNNRVVLEAEPPSEEKIHSLKQVLENIGLPVTLH